MVIIRTNRELASPMLFRLTQMADVTLEISEATEGFSIEADGREPVSGVDRREFHIAVRDLMMELRSQA